MSPRPSLANLLEKRRSIQVDNAKDPAKCDKLFKRNGHMLTVDDALERDLKKDSKGRGRKSSFSFSNTPFSSLFGGRDLEVVPENSRVRRAGSHGQICEAIKRDLISIDKSVKRAGSQNQLCHVTVTNDLGGVTCPLLLENGALGGSASDIPVVANSLHGSWSGGSSAGNADGNSVCDSEVADHFALDGGNSGSRIRGVSTVDKSTQFGDTIGGHLSDRSDVDNSDALHFGDTPSVYGNNSENTESKSAGDTRRTASLKPPRDRPVTVANITHVALVTSRDEARLSHLNSGAEFQGTNHRNLSAEFTQGMKETPGTSYSTHHARTLPETVVSIDTSRTDIVVAGEVSSSRASSGRTSATDSPGDTVGNISTSEREARDANSNMQDRNAPSSSRETCVEVKPSPSEELETTRHHQPVSAPSGTVCEPSRKSGNEEELACAGVLSGVTTGRGYPSHVVVTVTPCGATIDSGSLGDVVLTMTQTGAASDGGLTMMEPPVLGDMNTASMASQKRVSDSGSFEGPTEQKSTDDALPVKVTSGADSLRSSLRKEGDIGCSDKTKSTVSGFCKESNGAVERVCPGQQSDRHGTPDDRDTSEVDTSVTKSDDVLTTQS